MVPYQGSKDRFAKQILDFIKPKNKFYDMCCGTGAISLELVSRGFDPCNIVMVDAGPWGLFWKRIGDGTFDLNRFAQICDSFDGIEWCKHVRDLPVDHDDSVYYFLLLQAMSWNGAPVKFNHRNTFSTLGFRKRPAPSVELLFGRVVVAAATMRGVDGRIAFSLTVPTEPDATVYYDPPYGGHNPYGASLDVNEIPQREYFISYHMDLAPKSMMLKRDNKTRIDFEYISHVDRTGALVRGKANNRPKAPRVYRSA